MGLLADKLQKQWMDRELKERESQAAFTHAKQYVENNLNKKDAMIVLQEFDRLKAEYHELAAKIKSYRFDRMTGN